MTPTPPTTPTTLIPLDTGLDRRLVAAFLREADERSFLELYRRHTPRLLALSRRLLGSHGREAEDAVQETWMRAAPRLADFRWESALPTWLAGILVRCSQEARRSRSRSEELDAWERVEEAEARAHPPDGGRAWRTRIDLERALAALPDGFREVLVLHDVEGYTHEEIAALLAIETGTSKSQLSRARSRVRALLAEAGA